MSIRRTIELPTTLKTTFVFTKIPNSVHANRSTLEQSAITPANSLAEAMQTARNKAAITSFCWVHGGIQGDGLQMNEATFFEGETLALTSAEGAVDTYAVAELYDTADIATQEAIVSALRNSFLTTPFVDTATGSTDAPTRVVGGIVLCEFQDIKGGGAQQLIDDLIGSNSGEAQSKLQQFIANASQGRVQLDIDVYSGSDESPRWLTLRGNYHLYANDWNKVAREVDARIVLPSNWDFAIFVFPARTATAEQLASNWCKTGDLADIAATDLDGRELPYVIVDPAGSPNPVGVMIHEVMHAFGLPDLYSREVNRSHDHSIMSAIGGEKRLTLFEKLLLGWCDVTDVVFLKRGIYPIEVDGENGQGIVILPDYDAGREDIYFMERDQEGDIRLFMAHPDRQYSVISPVDVSAQFKTNGVFGSIQSMVDDAGGKIGRIIGVNPTYRPSNTATSLRENERLVAGRHHFRLTPIGTLNFNDAPFLTVGGDLVSAAVEEWNVHGAGYGFCAFVDDRGVFNLARGTQPASEAVLKQIKPAGKPLDRGEYYLQLEERSGGGAAVAIYRRQSTGDAFVYDLFSTPYLSRGGQIKQGEYILKLDTNGDLTLQRGDAQIGSSFAVYSKVDNNPHFASFDSKGALSYYDRRGELLKTFSGKKGEGPFRIAIEESQPNVVTILVKDAAEQILYTLYSVVTAGWQTASEMGHLIGLDSKNRLTVNKGEQVLFKSDIDGEDMTRYFTQDGWMRWVKAGATWLKTYVGERGVGPYHLALANAAHHRCDLVVRDAENRTLYSICGYLEAGWATQQGDFRIELSAEKGSLLVSGKGANDDVAAAHLRAEQRNRPITITFDDEGTMRWWNKAGEQIKLFSGERGRGPFELVVVSGTHDRWELVVKDVSGRTLYTVGSGVGSAKDDLTRIEGIGPKTATLLHEAGITSFDALADSTTEQLEAILDAGGARFNLAVPDTWPQQARLAAAADWAQLETLQKALTGGRE